MCINTKMKIQIRIKILLQDKQGFDRHGQFESSLFVKKEQARQRERHEQRRGNEVVVFHRKTIEFLHREKQ